MRLRTRVSVVADETLGLWCVRVVQRGRSVMYVCVEEGEGRREPEYSLSAHIYKNEETRTHLRRRVLHYPRASIPSPRTRLGVMGSGEGRHGHEPPRHLARHVEGCKARGCQLGFRACVGLSRADPDLLG
jgi:hypothetical protein